MNDSKIDANTLWETLRQVVDPEIGCNIVDLGLVYDVSIENGKVLVKMTLTARGCPMHESLIGGVKNAFQAVPGVAETEVELVWDPPWTPEMMTEFGRACVGYRN